MSLRVLFSICAVSVAAGCSLIPGEEGPPKTSDLAKAKAQQLAIGRLHACALTTAGGVRCWGYGPGGRLGDGETYQEAERMPAVQVVGLESGVSYVASGPSADFTCAVVAGVVKCWGDGTSGELGNGKSELASLPVDVVGISDATAVAVGTLHACALVSGGKVKCWGDNEDYQLGNGNNQPTKVPVEVSGLVGATQLAAGAGHTCAIVAGGKVVCWGSNTDVQCGQVEGAEFPTPTQVPGLSGVVELSVGGSTTCARTAAGALSCWGSNRYGQLGDGMGGKPFDERATPTPPSGLVSNVSAVALGSIFGFAVVDGALQVWGSFLEERLEPVAGPSLPAPPTAIGSGQSSDRGYACAITERGTYCWGDNSAGTVGYYYDDDDGQYYMEKPTPISSLD